MARTFPSYQSGSGRCGFAARVFGLRPTKRSSPTQTRKNLWYPGYAIWGLSLLLVFSLAARGFSPGILQKPTFPNSNLIRNARTQLNEFLRTPECFVDKQIPDCTFFNNIIKYVTKVTVRAIEMCKDNKS